jgi:ribosomal-protein-alanine N-acetyltransferase
MFKTQRLILRPFEKFDYENWKQAYEMLRPAQNDWDEGPWKDSELTSKKFNSFLKNQKQLCDKDHFYTYGIFRKDDGVLLGTLHFMDVSRAIFQNAYLGYRIFNNYWNQGYATEACKGALEIAFKELKLHRVEAGIEPANKSSIRVAKKIGLRKEGLSQKRLLVNGKWKDMQIFAGTCEDFGRKYKR